MSKEIEQNKSLDKLVKKILIGIGIFGVIAIVFTLGQNAYDDYKLRRENLNLDEYIVVTTLKKTDTKTNDKRDRIISMEDSEDTRIINLNLDLAIKNNSNLDTAVGQTMEILEELTKDKEFRSTIKNISFRWWTLTVDNYGNEGRSLGISITLDIETLKKVNWDNITREGFKNISNFLINRQLYPDYN